MYKFNFMFRKLSGLVEVSPGAVYVTWGGVGCHMESLRGPILKAIFKAKLTHSEMFARIV